jgi:hypothetical protein
VWVKEVKGQEKTDEGNLTSLTTRYSHLTKMDHDAGTGVESPDSGGRPM